MPTALNGRETSRRPSTRTDASIFIKDPPSSGACYATAGGPGCFSGNMIPPERLDPNALALMRLHAAAECARASARTTTSRGRRPRPTRASTISSASTRARQRTARSGAHCGRSTPVSTDRRSPPDPRNGASSTGRTCPATTRSAAGGTASSSPPASTSSRPAFAGRPKASGPRPTPTGSASARATSATPSSQFNPGLNTLDLIPTLTFGLGTTGIDSPDFTFDNRIGSTAFDWLASVRDNFTWTHGRHTIKVGGHFEYMQNNEARGGTWMGQFQFNNNTSNPLNTNFAFSNAVLGIYSQYTETDRYGDTHNRQWWSEWYGQDTWQATSRLTIDYGVRFLIYSPYCRSDDLIANFEPSTYDPSRAPRLYQPAIVNGTRVALDPVTGQTLNQITSAPTCPTPATSGTASSCRPIPASRPASASSCRRSRSHVSASRWDLTGQGTTILHSSAGVFHNARLGGGSLGNLRNPPFIHNPILFYNTMRSTFVPGVTLANRPATIEALETDYSTRAPTTGRSASGVTSAGARSSTRPTPATSGATWRCITTSTASPTPRASSISTRRIATRPIPLRRSARGIPAPLPRVSEHPRPRQLRQRRLSRAAGAGESALHPRPAIRRRVHAAARARLLR